MLHTPKKARRTSVARHMGVSIFALSGLAFADASLAQTTPNPPADGADSGVVIVTGFRASLATAIAAKKKEDGIVDVIKSEDIGKFPDNNLSEAIQRIPGVSIDRDAGEGRTITVRGLGPGFTRVRIDGMEALATTGGRDSSGGANRDRGFDFNVFAAELFQSITVRKASAAETEEGALGATVDLQTPRPMDYKGFSMAGSVGAQYNDLSKKTNQRATFLVTDRWFGGKLGALLSVAYSTNDKFEEGPSTTRWENGSTLAGTSANRFHAVSTDNGATFTNIPVMPATTAPGNPGGTLSDLSGAALDITKALHPRIPRYGHLAYDESRLGVTSSIQWKPSADTLVTLDGMFSDFVANRNEQYLEVISFSRAGQGTPQTDVYSYNINSKGELYKASFNKVDIRSENRHDELDTKFTQLGLTVNQNFGDRLKLKAFIGASRSVQDNPEQTTLTLDAYDVNGYSYDYSEPNAPVFNYGKVGGCTVDQACYWQVSPSTAKGDASLVRVRPNKTTDRFSTATLDFTYKLSDGYSLKFGVNQKKFIFHTFDLRRSGTLGENISTAAATYVNANLSSLTQIQTLGGGVQPWLIPNFDAIKAAIHFDCACVDPTYGDWTVTNNGGSRGNNQDASENDDAAYVQLDFRNQLWGVPVRGNVGVRAVTTKQSTSGFIDATNYVVIDRKYTDTLPSFSLTAEASPHVLVRLAAARNMARPLLGALTPGGTINFTGRTYAGGNPYLNPTRADSVDLNFEYYPDKDSLFSFGLFYKNLKTYIQPLPRTLPYSALGFDPALGAAFSITADTPFAVTSPVNAPGGPLRGWEANIQKSFTFLPAPFDKFGGVFNYTHVTSEIDYYTSATTTLRAPLLNMSPDAYNATLYYEGDKLSARISAAHRSKYISLLKPGNNADFQGKNATLNIDAQATYVINRNLTLTLQGLNLTDQYDDRYDTYNSTTFGNVDGNAPLDYVHTGRSFLMGLRYKY